MTTDHPSTEPTAGVLLLGLMSGRPHAARFTADEHELARKAAGLMGLHVMSLDEPHKVEAAKKIQSGRVFASGKTFAPFCKATTYLELCALGGIDPEQELSPAVASSERLPGEANEAAPTQYRLPTGWDDLGPGCLCLASEGIGHGWYFVIIVDEAKEGGFTVAWRDFRELDAFVRRSDELALLPPNFSLSDQQTGA